MTLMNVPTSSEILDVTARLPSGATLVIPHVRWEDYERLLEGLAERPRLRVSYDCGRLEIVSPSGEHEETTRFIDRMVYAFAEIFGQEVEPRGSATWKSLALRKGVEGGCCYYVQNAERIIGKRDIDLESDPPPDIVVEVDITGNSLNKFPIYAALGVPEIWRYDGKTVHFYALAPDRYILVPESRFFASLTGQMLAVSIELSKTHGQEAALRVFREHCGR
jgi:Uma2 family endonuclease